MLPQEIIRLKRDGGTLSAAQIGTFVQGLVKPEGEGSWDNSQIGAMAMAVLLQGMTRDETVAFTRAMTHSGEVLDWSAAGLPGPILDKHSTGGVGDKVSLMLAPIVAACGGVVPMVSGRGLGHTGGTLDKLEALPGYGIQPDRALLLQVLRQTGCAIVGASSALAPADRRLYAIRDVTATVESLPLITASILSKKLAAGLQGLVLDVKTGNGAFTPTQPQALELARSLVDVARGAGLPARALVTDMNQVLGRTAGNGLEVQEALDYLAGTTAKASDSREPRLHAVTVALAGELLHLGGLAASVEAGRLRAQAVLDSGAAAERFAQMVAALGGPADVFRDSGLVAAPVRVPVPAPQAGALVGVDVRALGLAVVALGGGRSRPGRAIDPRVGFSGLCALGAAVQAGEPLAWVHAATEDAADQAVAAMQAAVVFGEVDTASPAAASPGAVSPVLARWG